MTDLSTEPKNACSIVAKLHSLNWDPDSLQREISSGLFDDALAWGDNNMPALEPVATNSSQNTGDQLRQLLDPDGSASVAILIPRIANTAEVPVDHAWLVGPMTILGGLSYDIIKRACETRTLILWTGDSPPPIGVSLDGELDPSTWVKPTDPIGLLALGIEYLESEDISYDAFLDLAHLVGHCSPSKGEEGSGCIGGLKCPPPTPKKK